MAATGTPPEPCPSTWYEGRSLAVGLLLIHLHGQSRSITYPAVHCPVALLLVAWLVFRQQRLASDSLGLGGIVSIAWWVRTCELNVPSLPPRRRTPTLLPSHPSPLPPLSHFPVVSSNPKTLLCPLSHSDQVLVYAHVAFDPQNPNQSCQPTIVAQRGTTRPLLYTSQARFPPDPS